MDSYEGEAHTLPVGLLQHTRGTRTATDLAWEPMGGGDVSAIHGFACK